MHGSDIQTTARRGRGSKGKGRGIMWIRAHVGYRGDDCLIWPMSRDNHGHGHFGFEGKRYKAHQFMCALVDGPRPSPRHHAAHSCGNGHLGCVNPKHLSWKTPRANQLDRIAHGTISRPETWGKLGKLSDDQVRQIVELRGQKTQNEIASMFGITAPTVRRIHKHGTNHVYTSFFPWKPEDVEQLMSLLSERKTYPQIAAAMGRRLGSIAGKIQRIREGR